MSKPAPMPPAQAVQIAILVLEWEAETTGDGVWRYEAIEAAKALRRMSENVRKCP